MNRDRAVARRRPACGGLALLALLAASLAPVVALAGDAGVGDPAAPAPRVAAARGAGDAAIPGPGAGPPEAGPAPASATPELPPGTRNGRAIIDAFVDGLADSDCAEGDASARWRGHFAASPRRLASSDETLALFGYVVDAVRAVHLPTEYALIPFVESGYKPGARSRSGPAGLWQFIALTARNHKVPVRAGYDGRLSPVASTRAAVRYLRTLHGMFAGNWRLASMAFNAGEYRILGALRRGGMAPSNAEPARVPGLSGITYAYPRKMHAISCLLQEARAREAWLQDLDRPVPLLEAVELPEDVLDIEAWAARQGHDPGQLRRLNPAWAAGRVPRRSGETLRVLVPVAGSRTAAAPGMP